MQSALCHHFIISHHFHPPFHFHHPLPYIVEGEQGLGCIAGRSQRRGHESPEGARRPGLRAQRGGDRSARSEAAARWIRWTVLCSVDVIMVMQVSAFGRWFE